MTIIITLLLFILWINCLPPLVSLITDDRWGLALDGGRLWTDGRPVFGSHKTVRGIVASMFGGVVVFPLLGVPWWVAGLAAFLAMSGDLLSSFIKRRLNQESGEAVLALDQIFEALFPLAFLNVFISLSITQNLIILTTFIVTADISSRLWNWSVGRPIPENYPRVVRSSVRFREWRACHLPLAKWQVWFNLTSFLSDQILLTWLFKLTGLYRRGMANALDIQVEQRVISLPLLPRALDGFRVLFLVDLHLDGLPGIETRLTELVEELEVDLCCIGGDIRMKTYGQSSDAINKLKRVMQAVRSKNPTLGILGNHDCIEMLPDLEDAGVIMLVNDAWPVTHNGETLWVMGVDDPHYYRLHDAAEAAEQVRGGEFSIFLAHSPEAFEDAAEVQADLYLCGHTHAGQVCLAPGKPILTNSRAPRHTAEGHWQYEGMQGYTSRGVGPSSIPVRFNCPGEVTVITLCRQEGG